MTSLRLSYKDVSFANKATAYCEGVIYMQAVESAFREHLHVVVWAWEISLQWTGTIAGRRESKRAVNVLSKCSFES